MTRALQKAIGSVMGDVGKKGVSKADVMKKMGAAIQAEYKKAAEAKKLKVSPEEKLAPPKKLKPPLEDKVAPPKKLKPPAEDKLAPPKKKPQSEKKVEVSKDSLLRELGTVLKAGTPQDTMKTVARAYKTGHRGLLKSCFITTPASDRFLSELALSAKVMIQYYDKLLAANYDMKGLEPYYSQPQAFCDNVDKAKIKIGGDGRNASAQVPGIKELYILKKDAVGLWKVYDQELQEMTDEEANDLIYWLKSKREALKKTMPLIGKLSKKKLIDKLHAMKRASARGAPD